MSRQDLIRIGYCLSLTGPLAGNSRSAQLAHEIWRDAINSRGGLLGRPVELLCYDDEADASRVPALYRRLIDEDNVDLIIGGYGTNTILPAIYIQHNPNIPQGRDALAALVAGLSQAVYYEPGRMVAEGDLVAIHGRIRGWADAPQVVVDLFRIEGGKLAEHWDVLQNEMPANPALER